MLLRMVVCWLAIRLEGLGEYANTDISHTNNISYWHHRVFAFCRVAFFSGIRQGRFPKIEDGNDNKNEREPDNQKQNKFKITCMPAVIVNYLNKPVKKERAKKDGCNGRYNSAD